MTVSPFELGRPHRLHFDGRFFRFERRVVVAEPIALTGWSVCMSVRTEVRMRHFTAEPTASGQ